MEIKSTLYQFSIIQQPPSDFGGYLWQRAGKYKRLEDAEKALKQFKINFPEHKFKIVHYFNNYWFRDAEIEKKRYKETNRFLWNFLSAKGLTDEARDYIENKRNEREIVPFENLKNLLSKCLKG